MRLWYLSFFAFHWKGYNLALAVLAAATAATTAAAEIVLAEFAVPLGRLAARVQHGGGVWHPDASIRVSVFKFQQSTMRCAVALPCCSRQRRVCSCTPRNWLDSPRAMKIISTPPPPPRPFPPAHTVTVATAAAAASVLCPLCLPRKVCGIHPSLKIRLTI